tara:strand:+ start:1190 stop:2116 length:927 start_codon:yes stop_codon:yes gene_type:complete
MKAVMYHYVRQFDPKYPHFRFLDIENFKIQLDYFEQNFGFVSSSEWINYIKNGVMPEVDGKVLLTFDDALKCQYEYVFPELTRRGLWGIFYVPIQPYITGKLLDVHRIHLLCGAFDGSDLFSALKGLVSDEMIPDSKRQEFHEKTYSRQQNYTGVTEVKRILNYFIDYAYQESIIDKLASHFRYEFNPSEFYISRESLKEMSDNGMIIGSHTVNHPVMSKLSKSDQQIQIVDSFRYLENLGLTNTRTYCHPYGGFHTFDSNTVSLLNDHAIEFSFNVESREITAQDITESTQYLPRFDCNEFPHGKAS